MKNSPLLRFFIVGIVHGILYVLGVLLFPIYYPLNKVIAKYKIWFLIWFINTSEKDYISNTYGDEAYRIRRGFDYYNSTWLRKLWEALIWMAFRNSHWWFRLNVFFPKQGEPYDIDVRTNDTTPKKDGMIFCNYKIWGKQYARYSVGGYRYFRYSFNKPFLGGRLNLHSGWAPDRWILKLRWFKIKKMETKKTFFTDANGKLSPKRVMGTIAVVVGLAMGVAKYFIEEKGDVTDVLILGIITAGFAAMSMDVFKSKQNDNQ